MQYSQTEIVNWCWYSTLPKRPSAQAQSVAQAVQLLLTGCLSWAHHTSRPSGVWIILLSLKPYSLNKPYTAPTNFKLKIKSRQLQEVIRREHRQVSGPTPLPCAKCTACAGPMYWTCKEVPVHPLSD